MSEPRKRRMSVGNKALIGLAAGLAVGAAITASGRPGLLTFGSAIEVVGTLWINAILMTIIPLVVSKIIVSIAGAQACVHRKGPSRFTASTRAHSS